MAKEIIVCGFLITFVLNFADALKKNCKEELVQRCPMALPVLSSRDISFALTRDELEKSCIELRAGIKCVDNYTEVCMEKHDGAVFRDIYGSIADGVQELCTPGRYQDEYLEHADCMNKVREEYETCSRGYEVVLATMGGQHRNDQYQMDADFGGQEDYLRTVCCSFQEYLSCSERTVRRSCGDEAASFTSAFLERMSSNIIKKFCFEYRDQECGLAPGSAALPVRSTLALAAAVAVDLAIFLLSTNLIT